MNDKRMAPVQGYSVGIPWSLHLRAWDAYAAKYGRYQSAERIAERAGFSVGELDMFVPGWREEVSEITKLRAEVARLTAILDTVAELRIDKWLDCEARRLKVFNAELEDEVARLTAEVVTMREYIEMARVCLEAGDHWRTEQAENQAMRHINAALAGEEEE